MNLEVEAKVPVRIIDSDVLCTPYSIFEISFDVGEIVNGVGDDAHVTQRLCPIPNCVAAVIEKPFAQS